MALTPARPSPPAPVSPIHAALVDQAQELQELHGLLSHLEDRLGPVLGMAKPQPGALEKNPSPGVQVVERIRGGNHVLAIASSRVRDFLERLEL